MPCATVDSQHAGAERTDASLRYCLQENDGGEMMDVARVLRLGNI
jgi:hypothetical protein